MMDGLYARTLSAAFSPYLLLLMVLYSTRRSVPRLPRGAEDSTRLCFEGRESSLRGKRGNGSDVSY
jgi:hypothetical protein